MHKPETVWKNKWNLVGFWDTNGQLNLDQLTNKLKNLSSTGSYCFNGPKNENKRNQKDKRMLVSCQRAKSVDDGITN